tara:strand:+ start:4034 stop:4639 length:606 start_codon:yes stop_codon:yes gene_type:complete
MTIADNVCDKLAAGISNRSAAQEICGDINANFTNNATNTTNIATNVTNIATNVTNIATNVTNIATNVTAIALNTAVKDKIKGGAFGVTFVVGAPHTSLVNVAMQLTDETGADCAEVCAVDIILFADAAGISVSATTLDSIAIGVDGLLLQIVANQMYRCTSEADGDIDIDFTDATSTDTLYVGVILPSGKIAISGAVTFTA